MSTPHFPIPPLTVVPHRDKKKKLPAFALLLNTINPTITNSPSNPPPTPPPPGKQPNCSSIMAAHESQMPFIRNLASSGSSS